ncbi:hypothetical protein BLA29_006535 [Euroglyphus maynei]|uniref:Uncharacterized protein n=1 Tax=Euroglyphus maynei TaxID=6958 RepID=A0A1Y3B523_EURMA|nr:hypothetical protein BLA29_006535 [Euroglyphus maynei]
MIRFIQVLSKHIKKVIRERIEIRDILRNSDFVKIISIQQPQQQQSLNINNDEDFFLLIDNNNTHNNIDDNNGGQDNPLCIPKYFIDNFEKPVAVDIYTVFEFPQLSTIAKNFFISLYLISDELSMQEVCEIFSII